MLEERRHQYLHAMGISIWQARDLPTTNTSQPGASISSEQQPTQPTHNQAIHEAKSSDVLAESPDPLPATNKQPNQWLIWIAEHSSEQHSGIIADLQAVCQYILPNSPLPAITHQQPDNLQEQTAILGIGLSDENQSWLSRQPNPVINIPGLAEWRHQPVAKQQVWRKLQEVLW